MTLHRHTSTILFDLDGTIADTNELIIRSFLETLAFASGRDDWRREMLLANWGLPLRTQLRALYPAIEMDAAVAYYRERYAVHEVELLAEFPGMRAALEALQAADVRMGVVTSKKHALAAHTLERLDYARFMDVLVGEEDAPRHKPHPDPLLQAATMLGVSPRETAYVGDNPDDVTAARAAGMLAVAVGWCVRSCAELQAAGPDVVIDTPGALVAIAGGALVGIPE